MSVVATLALESSLTAVLKSFGRREAYESRGGTNPRVAGTVYGEFDFQPIAGMGWRRPRPVREAASLQEWRVARPFPVLN